MTGIETVQRLIQGSRNLNRMKEEIQLVIGMIIELIPEITKVGCGDFAFGTETCRWEVKSESRPGRHFMIRCLLQRGHIVELGYSSQREVPFYAKYVQRVYEELPVLVGEMFREYPELEIKLLYLINASYATFGH